MPVVWVEGEEPPHAGRLDVTAAGFHLDGGPRTARRTRDVPFADIASFRIGRSNGDRVVGRLAIVLELIAGGRLAFAPFDRAGGVHELVERLQLAGARASEA